MDKRYQIFISSTYEDLKSEREQVIKAVLEMGHIPVGMEMFNAADEDQWKVIQRTIDSSDYYVVRIAHRYGSIAPQEKISFTEKEYDYARTIGLPCIGFVIDSSAAWPANFTDKGKSHKSLENFKLKVKGKPVDFWINKDDLKSKFAIAMPKVCNIQPGVGWIRSSGAISSEVFEALAQSVTENQSLKRRLENLEISSSPRGRAMHKRLIDLGQIAIEFKYNGEIGQINAEAIRVFKILCGKLASERLSITDLDDEIIADFLTHEHHTLIEIEIPAPDPDIAIFGLYYKNIPIYITEFKRMGLITGDGNISLTEDGKSAWDYQINIES